MDASMRAKVTKHLPIEALEGQHHGAWAVYKLSTARRKTAGMFFFSLTPGHINKDLEPETGRESLLGPPSHQKH